MCWSTMRQFEERLVGKFNGQEFQQELLERRSPGMAGRGSATEDE